MNLSRRADGRPVERVGEAYRDNGKAPETVGQQPLLQTRAVEYSFGMTRALRGIDLDIREGESLAVMGPSGSGKSTLMHVLAGVLVPDVGTVRYRGEDMGSWSEERRANLRLTDFGFVFQFGQLLPDLSALDNVTIPLLLAGIERRKAVPRARDALVALGLEAELDRLPGKMSGGQAQRVAIARALVAHPRVIFADEPTGSLDSFAAEQVMDALVRRVREDGSTLVLITHDARTAAYADREVIVRDGRISAGTGSSNSAGAARGPVSAPREFLGAANGRMGITDGRAGAASGVATPTDGEKATAADRGYAAAEEAARKRPLSTRNGAGGQSDGTLQ